MLANGVAWLVGLPGALIAKMILTFVFQGETGPFRPMVEVEVVSGVLMGVVVGAITGIGLVWLLRRGLSPSGQHTVQTE